jgi:hypothetical protein
VTKFINFKGSRAIFNEKKIGEKQGDVVRFFFFIYRKDTSPGFACDYIYIYISFSFSFLI